ncbi:phage GP46 family protein [Vreelandella maris]|jgi:phage gp46-like protein|uniref:Phage GP46 family protein n=1 Tax=Vreelandella maris TaxID=2729617 RepID=A0A7Y6VAK9_9GAMM|nr:phage GP46 family protein [Halomonas maris]NVF16005.1 phage GP46 family protein [Halomonas maris]
MDITLDWLDQALDVALIDGDLATDDGLRTAVALSLLCDRRAEPDDIIPDGTDNRRGWWADAIADEDGDRWGSRLWLLGREKELPEVRRRAEAYAREALDWLLEDGVATEIDVTAETLDRDVLWLKVIIKRGDGSRLADRYQYVWS